MSPPRDTFTSQVATHRHGGLLPGPACLTYAPQMERPFAAIAAALEVFG